MRVAVYCFDTSAFLDGWNRNYPPDVFPQLWATIEERIAQGSIIATEEVREELSRKDDALLKWAKRQQGLFRDLDSFQQEHVSEMLAKYPRLIEQKKGRSGADPFVIALARVSGATVVTGENDDGTHEKPKIPTVCTAYGVRCIKVLDFIRDNGWVFSHRS
jgi:hypothetical protein